MIYGPETVQWIRKSYSNYLICNEYPHFKELLAYLSEKFFIPLIYIPDGDVFRVVTPETEDTFIQQIIEPWLDKWAIKNKRVSKKPRVLRYKTSWEIIIPLDRLEVIYIEEMEKEFKAAREAAKEFK